MYKKNSQVLLADAQSVSTGMYNCSYDMMAQHISTSRGHNTLILFLMNQQHTVADAHGARHSPSMQHSLTCLEKKQGPLPDFATIALDESQHCGSLSTSIIHLVLPSLDAASQRLHLLQLTANGTLAALQMLQPAETDARYMFEQQNLQAC